MFIEQSSGYGLATKILAGRVPMAADTETLAKPGHKAIRIAPDGSAFVEGFRCDACGAAFPEATMACRACASRTVPHPFRAAETGKLFTWSVVSRSYPGIAVPFVSAIVDLDDGLTLKGTLRDVASDKVKAGMPVRLVIDNAGGATDKDGAPYVGFHFTPMGDA
jgi:uncharacterized OB-fold protein